MKRAFIFTGQGEKLGIGGSQLTTFWMSVALAKILIANGIKPDVLAGLSLGEFTCFAVANVFKIEELEQIIKFRQKITDEALCSSDTGMLACMGLSTKEVKKRALKYSLIVTNYNSPVQTVVGGRKNNIEEFKKSLLPLKNVLTVDLPVIGAFHSPYLREAKDAMRDFLTDFRAAIPTIPIYYNLTGNKDAKDLKEIIEQHLISPVQFQKTIENMLDEGVSEFISVGIGSTPVGLIRQTCKAKNKRIKVEKVESLEDIRGLIG